MSAWRDPGICDPPPSPENRRLPDETPAESEPLEEPA